jgi:hypothetical protein
MSESITTPNAAKHRVPRAAPRRPTRAAYWVAGTVAVAGLAVAFAWAVFATLDTIDRVDDFPRTAIPGTVSAPVTERGEMLVYYEGSGKPTPRQLGLTVAGPDGTPVSLKTYDFELQYDAPGALGVASAVASFQAAGPGSYQVSAADTSRRHARLAVGENIGRGLESALLWPGLLALAAVSVGTAIAVAAHRRRFDRGELS